MWAQGAQAVVGLQSSNVGWEVRFAEGFKSQGEGNYSSPPLLSLSVNTTLCDVMCLERDRGPSGHSATHRGTSSPCFCLSYLVNEP